MQAEVDELKEELEEEQFLSSFSAETELSQPEHEAAHEAARKSPAAELPRVEDLETMLATAREEARVSVEAEAVASGSIGGLRALVTELECKLEKATEAQPMTSMPTKGCHSPEYRQQDTPDWLRSGERTMPLQEKPEARLDRAREEARAAREEARVAREVARVSVEAKVTATGTIKELRTLVAELEGKLEVAREVELRRTATEAQLGREDHAPRSGAPRPALELVRRMSLLDDVILPSDVILPRDVYEALIGGQIEQGQSPRFLTDEARAALKIQAVARGWSGRTDYKLVRDMEACRQWVAYHVALGEYEEAERLGWDGEHPSPLSRRELEANVMNERSVKDDEPLVTVRDSAPAATQRPPRYRRTRSANTAARASPLAIHARSSSPPMTSMPAKRCHSPEYRQQDTPDWLRSGERAMRATVTVQPKDDIEDVAALSRGDPHQDMLELVRDVEACRQWVAYHVARGEYKDAVELGWDGTNPLALTVQELIEASIAAYAALKDEALSSPRDVSVEVFPRSPATCTAHASPSALLCPQPRLSRDECIEVTARPLTNPQLQNMIEVAAYAPTSSILPSSMETSQLQPAHSQLVDEHPVHLTILERQASFLKSAKENERLEESVNNAASARVNERLERARKHNWHVAKMAAASTTVGRHARGHLTRVRLRREGEAARMSKLQRETERAWAKT